jgi:hypothetical protein
MAIMHPVGTRVTIMEDSLLGGTVIGYGFDHITGNIPRTVYLVELDKGGYVGETGTYVRILVVHPDNLDAITFDDGPYKASPGGY